MSGLWGWWRREREEAPAKCIEPETEKDEAKEDGDEEEKNSTDTESSETDSESQKSGDETVIDNRDIGVPDDSPISTEEPSAVSDYDEVREIPKLPEQEEIKIEIIESAVENVLEEATTEDHEWSDDEWDAAQVPTVTLTLNLKPEEGICTMEESVTPLYEPPPCLYSADAKLAPVYSTVNKAAQKEDNVSADIPIVPEPEEQVYQELPLEEERTRTPTPVPPPIPAPDWDDLKKDVIWRIGKMRRMKKWIGGTKVNNIPNRLSKMLSQDYLCHQVTEK